MRVYVGCDVRRWHVLHGHECITYGDGDFDSDGDVDLRDFAQFQFCFGDVPVGICESGNMAGNGVIDILDFDIFAVTLTPPNAR